MTITRFPATTRDKPLVAGRFLDREASWLDFNERVLELAADPNVPLLERMRFVAIFATNLDEFFMVRVAKLQRRLATGIALRPSSGMTAQEQLDLIYRRSHVLASRHANLVEDVLVPELRREGIEILAWASLSLLEQRALRELFRTHISPVLTPLAADTAHPFAYISGLSLNLAVVLQDPEAGLERLARVTIPSLLPRLVPLAGNRFVPLEAVVTAHLPELFNGMRVSQSYLFRVTRNEDLEVEEDEADNRLRALETELLRREFGPPVRLEVEDSMSAHVWHLLSRELGISTQQLVRLPGLLDLSGLLEIADLDRPQLKFPPFQPAIHPRLREHGADQASDIFATLRAGDVLLHHPYDCFATSVQALIERAAGDPRVLAIKQTLYRTSGDSPIVDALIEAAESGKQVLVVVEITARWDEQANIKWARALVRAGCHVVYGLVGLKTHCKLTLIVREENDGALRRYAHLGTGNYHPKTARLYEDFGLLTADPEVCTDVANLFNHVSGDTRHGDYTALLVAPESLRARLIALIEREAQHARAGLPAGVIMKVNSLVDEQVIDALYAASRADVRIDLVVRGMCALRPGVPGLSDNIVVRSILGRFLEHSRVFRFANAGNPEIWLGSADMMHRNLDRRVEALVRVLDGVASARIEQILAFATSEDVDAWLLCADGSWRRRRLSSARALLDYQQELVSRHKTVNAGLRPSLHLVSKNDPEDLNGAA